MRLRMRTTAAGPHFSARSGQVVEVSDDLAEQLVDGGYAELVGDPPAAATPAPAPPAPEPPKKRGR